MTNQQELVDEYLNAFTEHQRFVMNVAIEQLGSSFNVAKSTGFVKWKAKREAGHLASRNKRTKDNKGKIKKDTY